MKTKIRVYFCLIGNFDPKEVTTALGIEPADTWRRGDPKEIAFGRHENDYWASPSCEAESFDLSDQFKEVLDLIVPHSRIIKEICQKYGLVACFRCVINIEVDQAPGIHFDNEDIKKISDLNAEIDIDLYP